MDAGLADGHANRRRADAPRLEVPLIGAGGERREIQPAHANRLAVQHIGLGAGGVRVVALRRAGRVPPHAAHQLVIDPELVVRPVVADLIGDEAGAMEGQRDVLLFRGLVAVVVLGLDIVAVRILLGRPTRTRRADGGEGQTHGRTYRHGDPAADAELGLVVAKREVARDRERTARPVERDLRRGRRVRRPTEGHGRLCRRGAPRCHRRLRRECDLNDLPAKGGGGLQRAYLGTGRTRYARDDREHTSGGEQSLLQCLTPRRIDGRR